MDDQALLDELDDLMTDLEDDLGRPLTEDEIDQLIDYVYDEDEVEDVENVFCATGEGGGVDPSCGGNGSGVSAGGVGKSLRSLAEVYPNMQPIFVKKLVEYQVREANELRKRHGLPETEFELKLLLLDDVKPSQSGEDYENDSSRYTATHIAKYDKERRKEDYAPIAVDENMVITDGNHRHAARKIAGVKTIPVLVPKRKG